MGRPKWAEAMAGRASSQEVEGSPQLGAVHGTGAASPIATKRL